MTQQNSTSVKQSKFKVDPNVGKYYPRQGKESTTKEKKARQAQRFRLAPPTDNNPPD